MKIDLFVDLNSEDETGLPWSYLDQATDPSVVAPGRFIVVGSGSAVAIAEVMDVAPDGLVHVRPLPGPVSEQRLAEATQRAQIPAATCPWDLLCKHPTPFGFWSVPGRGGRTPGSSVELVQNGGESCRSGMTPIQGSTCKRTYLCKRTRSTRTRCVGPTRSWSRVPIRHAGFRIGAR